MCISLPFKWEYRNKSQYTGQSFSLSDFWHMLGVCSTLGNLLMGCKLWFALRQMPVWCCSTSSHPQLPVLGSPRMTRVNEKFLTALLFKKTRLERLCRTKGRGLSILPCLGGKPVPVSSVLLWSGWLGDTDSIDSYLCKETPIWAICLKSEKGNEPDPSVLYIDTIYPYSDKHWRKQWGQKSG